MKIIFLDIDGVLNTPKDKWPCGYNRLCPDNVASLNCLLASMPDLKIVMSSAWRYYIHNGDMTIRGLEQMFMTHGLNAWERIVGVTDKDPEDFGGSALPESRSIEEWHELGKRWRAGQIIDWVSLHYQDVGKGDWVAVDDIELDLPDDCFVRTDAQVGLTSLTCREIASRLSVSTS